MKASTRKPKPQKSLLASIWSDLLLSLPDALGTSVFLVTVVLTGQWVRLVKSFLLPNMSASLEILITLIWVYATCVLCIMSLRPESFNAWSVLDSKLSTQRKIARIAVQLTTAVGFALLVSFADAKLKSEFDRKFIGITTYEQLVVSLCTPFFLIALRNLTAPPRR
jgi:hypothetical protein